MANFKLREYFAVKNGSAGKYDKNQRNNNNESWILDENKLHVFSMMHSVITYRKPRLP